MSLLPPPGIKSFKDANRCAGSELENVQPTSCKIVRNSERTICPTAQKNPSMPTNDLDRGLVVHNTPQYKPSITSPRAPYIYPRLPVCFPSDYVPYFSEHSVRHKVEENKARRGRARVIELLSQGWYNKKDPWRCLSPFQRLAHACLEAEQQGGLTINLNLTERLQDRLRESKDPSRALGKLIHEELSREAIQDVIGSVPPYGFVLEVSPDEKLHIHGFIIPGSFASEYIAAIKIALEKAGGKMPRDTQFRRKFLFDAIGWTAYCLKSHSRTMRFLRTNKAKKSIFLSRPMVQLCKANTDDPSQYGEVLPAADEKVLRAKGEAVLKQLKVMRLKRAA